MKRVPCMTLFFMTIPSEVSDTGFIKVRGEFFYSIKTDTLYIRNNSDSEWKIQCDSGCRDKECPITHPEKYYFDVLGEVKGTKLPAGAM